MLAELAVATSIAPSALAQESPEMLATLLAVLNEQAERMKER